MKTTKAVRLSDNFVGVEINTIQDVVKAQAAGLKLVDKEGWEYSIYTIDDEETGEERDPTEQEIFEHITIEKNEDKEVCKLLLGYDSTYTNGVDVFATKEKLVESLMKE